MCFHRCPQRRPHLSLPSAVVFVVLITSVILIISSIISIIMLAILNIIVALIIILRIGLQSRR